MSEAVGMPCRDQVHDTLPCVGRDPCLIKQKGFVDHMVVASYFFFWVSVSQSAKTRKCHPPRQHTGKVNVKHLSANYEQQERQTNEYCQNKAIYVSSSLNNTGELGAFQIWNSQALTMETGLYYFFVVVVNTERLT